MQAKLVHSRPKPSPVSRNIEVIALFVSALCSKIEYDSLQKGKKDIYWPEALAEYQRILNEESKTKSHARKKPSLLAE